MTTRPVALVTGASRGIGRSTALRLAADHDIIGVARTASDLESLKGEVEAKGRSCRTIVLDLSDHDATDRALAGIECDVLVNNAGVGPIKPFLALSPAEWHRIVDVNFSSLYHVTRPILPGMAEDTWSSWDRSPGEARSSAERRTLRRSTPWRRSPNA
jgi:short-subunit dehydrogenase